MAKFTPACAAASLDAAAQAAPELMPEQFYIDINSVSPGRKRQAAAIIGERAQFVGMAVMAPVHPLLHKTPVLVSGPGAVAVLSVLARCGMEIADVGADAGAATSIKMVRSVMIKGLEALTTECFLAATRAGAAQIIDPRESATEEIAAVYSQYPHIGAVLPAMGYSPTQTAALRATIERSSAEVVVSGTPIDLAALIGTGKPIVRARYEFAELDSPGLWDEVSARLDALGLSR